MTCGRNRFLVLLLFFFCWRLTSVDRRVCVFFFLVVFLGEDKVAKQITLDDLEEDDIEALKGGSFQLLPGKDMAGRGVGFIARKFSTFKTWKSGVSTWLSYVS